MLLASLLVAPLTRPLQAQLTKPLVTQLIRAKGDLGFWGPTNPQEAGDPQLARAPAALAPLASG